LINALALVFFGILYGHGFFEGLTGAPLYGVFSIAAFTVAMTVYAGLLAWRTDSYEESVVKEPRDKAKIFHDLNHIFHAIWVCQILGIIGALVGYREQTKAAADTATGTGEAVQQVFSALGNGLVATMLGVLCSLLFFVEYRLIEHELGRD